MSIRKKRNILSLIGLIIILVLGPLAYFRFIKPRLTSAAWFDDKYYYRTAITITNSGSTDTNKKVKFDIDTATLYSAGKIKINCDDSRFTDTNGKQLQYYLDSASGACNTNSTDYYVLVPTINAGTTTIYHYYGNPSATKGSQNAQFSQATFSQSATSTATEEQSKAPVAYWSFNEGFGTTANDSTSNRNDGTLGTGASAPSWQTEDLCVAGKCLFFNGNNNFVDATSNVFSTLITAETDFTVSAWVKPVSFTNDGTVIGQRYGDSMVFGTRTTGKLFLNMDDTRESSPESSNALSLNSWQYVVATFKGTDSSHTVNFYINGKFSGSGTADDGEAGIDAQTNMFIGYESRFLKSFDGFIDEAKIYPYVRTAAEVKADYNAGKAHASSSKGSSASLGNNKNNSEAFSEGLVGYWKMNEIGWTGTVDEVIDSSGNGRHGKAACTGDGCTLPAISTGKFSNGGSNFAYPNQRALVMGDVINFGSTDNFTISAWVNITSGYQEMPGTITGKYNCCDQAGYRFNYEGGEDVDKFLNLYVSDGSNTYKITSLSAVPVGGWTHVVGVFDRSNNDSTKLYINGVSVGTTIVGSISSIGSLTSTSVLQIGAHHGSNPGGYDQFTGSIDEARIYNRALTPSEVEGLYNWAPGPVSFWKFEEGVRSSAYDSSGNNLNMHFHGSAYWAQGKYGKAMASVDANATLDYAHINDDARLDFTNTQDYTLNAWIKNGPHENIVNVLISKGGTSYSTKGYSLELNDDNKFACNYTDGDGSGMDIALSATAFPVNDGIFHFVSCVMDRSGIATGIIGLHVFVDGKLEGSDATITEGDGGTGNSTAFRVGEGSSTNWEFNSIYDNVQVYNYPRTQKQIIEDMNAGHPAGGGPVGSQVAKYSFDEGYGTSTNNSISGGASLTLGAGASAPSWSNDGKYGKALSFDGGGDFAYTANTALMAGTGQTYPTLAVSTWVYPQTSAASKTIIHKNNEFKLTTDANSKPNCSVYAGGSWQTAAVGSTALTSNSWSHLLCSYDGANIKIWVNGVNKGNQAETDQLTSSSSTALYIARDSTTAAGTFQGLIDDIKIYNYSLSEDEIKIDYNHGAAIVLGSTSVNTGNTASINAQSQLFCIPGDTTSCAPPVAYWNFEEGSGTTLYDRSGNGLDTTAFVGSPLWTTGKFGKALSFDGSDDYAYVSANSLLNFTGTNNFSFSVWAKPSLTGGGSYPRIFHKERWVSSSDCGGYMLAIPNSGYAQFVIKNNNNGVGPTALVTANQWVHLAGVYNGSTMYLYKNGILSGTAPNTTGTGTHPTNPFEIAGTSVFKGLVDELSIYNYARTPAQVAWDYNRGGPVSYWKLDECQGTSANDSSGNGNTGTITIGASGSQNTTGSCTLGVGQSAAWGNGSSGKHNSSLNFDGTDDYVDISNTSSFNLTSFTLSLWWNANTLLSGDPDSYAGPFNNRISNQNGFQFVNDISSTTSFVPHLVIWNGTSETAHFKATTSYSLPFNEWRHFIWTYDGSTAKLYVNGQQISITTSAVTNYPKTGVIIGYGYGHATGKIDDVKIFNYALTAAQIKNEYNEGSAVRFGPITGTP